MTSNWRASAYAAARRSAGPASAVPAATRARIAAGSSGGPASAAPTAAAAISGERYPTVWHQLASCSPVSRMTSARAAPGGAAADRHERRPGPGLTSHRERPVRGGRAAFVGDRQDERAWPDPMGRRRQRRFERLGSPHAVAAGQARAGCGIAQDLGRAEGPVLARPAAGHHHGSARGERRPHGSRQDLDGPARAGEPHDQSRREGRLGRDHVAHQVGRPVATHGHRRTCPRLGGARKGRLGVEAARVVRRETGRRSRVGRLHRRLVVVVVHAR